MASSVDDHKFNDDLLLHASDRKLAASKYPTILHVLDDPELRQLFIEYDGQANRAKRKGLKAGLWAIGFGFCALALAAAEVLFMNPAEQKAEPENWAKALAAVSFLCALASVVIGGVGVLFAGRKREWLHNRLMGESIRQFHFQTLAFHLLQILESLKNEEARSAFLAERKLWLESFKARMVGKLDAVFASAIREDEKIDPWLLEGARTRELAKFQGSRNLDPVFDAYRELRILHQLGYANHKLQDDHRILSAMPRTQLAVLSSASFIWIILLIALHFGVLLGAFLPDPVHSVFHSRPAIVAIIWFALAALATRAIEQGLQPEREIERYQQYRSAVRAILERYDEAPSQAAKIEIMREMERLVFDEMRDFLVTNERSRFVM